MFQFLICFIAGIDAGLGTGLAGMSAAVGIALAGDVLISAATLNRSTGIVLLSLLF